MVKFEQLRAKTLDILQYLNKTALKLYKTQLLAFEFEYGIDPNNPNEYVVTVEDASTNYGVKDNRAQIKCLSGVFSVDEYGQAPVEQDVRDWSNLLNHLADSGIWYFGSLLGAMYMSLSQDKNDNIWPLGTKEVRKDAGNAVTFFCCIGVHPKFNHLTAKELNVLAGVECFVEEGELGGRNWRLLHSAGPGVQEITEIPSMEQITHAHSSQRK